MLQNLVDSLGAELKKDLPGLSAQSIMAPSSLSGIKRPFKHHTLPRESAVLVLLYEELGVIKFPLTLRQTYPGVHSGQVSLPGGKKEFHDENLSKTALRETQEEIGVNKEDVTLIGMLSPHYVPPSNFNIQPYVGFLNEKQVFIREEKEVKRILEVNLTDIMIPKKRKMMPLKSKGNIIAEAPYFDLQGEKVWGATAMILSELSEIMNQIPKV